VKCPTCNGDAVLTGDTHVTANSREFTEALIVLERVRAYARNCAMLRMEPSTDGLRKALGGDDATA
jgi:hypothetical protein